jgi:hypothetical protein
VHLLRRLRAGLGDVLSAFEFMDGRSLNAVMQAQPELLRKYVCAIRYAWRKLYIIVILLTNCIV